MKGILTSISLLTLAFMAAGCVGGPTKDFYKPTGQVAKARPKGDPALFQTDDLERDVNIQLRNGYRMFGRSDYTGKFPETKELTKQAKKVKASIVFFEADHIGTASGVRTMALPGPRQTSTSQHSGSVYTSRGESAHYSGQTVTTGPRDYQYFQVPWTKERFEVHAVFLGIP